MVRVANRTVAAITGATSGIGAEFARRLAPDHDLLLFARRVERLEQIAADLSMKYQSRVEIVEADLSRDADLAAAVERIASEKRLAMLINSAGFGVEGRFWETDLGVQERMNRLHIVATVRLAHAALKNLVAHDRGALINVASVAAWVRRPEFVGYAATKSWMTAFTEGLYLDLRDARSNVIVQALCPGLVETEFHQAMGVDRKRLASAGLWMTAEEVVSASLDGLRRKKLFVIPGLRYRVLVALLSALPTAGRLTLQDIIMQGRGPAATRESKP